MSDLNPSGELAPLREMAPEVPVVGAAGKALISIRGLRKSYGSQIVLKDVSLDIEEGSFIALLGPSGCGKTTLLRSIGGFVEPEQGEILIDGRDMRRVPPNLRPVNTVFQSYALFPHMTVAQNIAFGPKRRGIERSKIPQIVDEALAMVGMGALAERYPAKLSGGQQQRVALARAIANKPRVLLLDEPLGALDMKLRKDMQIELKRLQQQLGMTFIYVTHDQEEALVMADRIAVMNQGEIAQIGTARQIYREPRTRYIADFIGDANLIACSTDSRGQLHIDSGMVPLPYSTGSANQTGLTLLVRPEQISFGAAPQTAADDVSVSAVVQQIIFIGKAVRIYFELRGGQGIHAEVGASIDIAALQPGAQTQVRWPRALGQLLSR